MTSNKTTELLREGLTERGIEWRSGLKGVTFVGDWCFVEYDSGKLAATCEPVLAPDQAIAAATMGIDEDYEAKMDALLSQLTNGKWSKTRQYSLEFMDACISEEFEALYSEEQFSAPVHGTLTAEQVKRIHEIIEKHWHDLPDEYDMPEATALSEYSYNWQAIADELNAELGNGTCEMIPLCSWLFECSKCGERHHKDDLRKYNYCPNCGAKVVRQ